MPSHPIVNLPIHVQDQYLRGFPADASESFCRAEREFADAIRRIAPTSWIAISYQFKVYSRLTTWPASSQQERKDEAVRLSRLSRVAPKFDEEIIQAVGTGAFDDGKLAEHFKTIGVTTLLFSGLRTKICVPRAVSGAISAGFNAIVVDDLLLDSRDTVDKDVQWHRAEIEKRIGPFELSHKWQFSSSKRLLDGQIPAFMP